jgi:hypothetical protein
MWNLSNYQTVIQNASFEQVLLLEAYNLIDGKPLMRDMADPEAKKERVEQLVTDMLQQMRSNPITMKEIEEKAQKNGISVERQLLVDARWIVNHRIQRGKIQL